MYFNVAVRDKLIFPYPAMETRFLVCKVCYCVVPVKDLHPPTKGGRAGGKNVFLPNYKRATAQNIDLSIWLQCLRPVRFV